MPWDLWRETQEGSVLEGSWGVGSVRPEVRGQPGGGAREGAERMHGEVPLREPPLATQALPRAEG